VVGGGDGIPCRRVAGADDHKFCISHGVGWLRAAVFIGASLDRFQAVSFVPQEVH